MNIRNQRGAVLIITYMVFYILLTLAAGFALVNYGELFFARRYYNTAAAFWLAEAGISEYLRDPGLLDQGPYDTSKGTGKIHLEKNDSHASKRIITATGIVGGVQKSIQIEFAANLPEIFTNSISVNGDILIDGKKTAFTALDRIRLSGKIKNEAKYSDVIFEDTKEGYNNLKVSMSFPDVNKDGKADEFADFVDFYRGLISSYPREQVLYIKGNGTFTITPDQSLNGKKIVYVEGNEGEGNVTIQLNGAWEKGQQMTVVSTGTVTFNQGGSIPSDSQLNIVAWTGYRETAALPSEFNGIIYTHGVATFDNILDTSVTNGCVIAQGGLSFGEVWSPKIFKFADLRKDGALPPGFQGLVSSGMTGYSDTPSSWKEI